MVAKEIVEEIPILMAKMVTLDPTETLVMTASVGRGEIAVKMDDQVGVENKVLKDLMVLKEWMVNRDGKEYSVNEDDQVFLFSHLQFSCPFI